MTKRQPNKKKRQPINPEPSGNSKKGIMTLLLWLLPIGLSAFLIYQSPNLINEIEQKNKKEKPNKAKVVLAELEKKSEKKVFEKNGNIENIESNAEKTIESKIVTLYFCELTETHAKLAPVNVEITQDAEKIPQVLNKLLIRPKGLSERYRSLIPDKTKFLGYDLKDKLLTINFSNQFLINNYGDIGKKLKIAQIVTTLTHLSEVDQVLFKVDGKKVKYLDSDGIILNRPLSQSDVPLKLALN